MTFFIRRGANPKATIRTPQTTKIFGEMDVAYKDGAFNKFAHELIDRGIGSLQKREFCWVDFNTETNYSGAQVVSRLANTIDSLFVRCCFDIAEYVGVHAELHDSLLPEILKRRNEPGYPILKWKFADEKLSVKHSSLARSIILTTDAIVESIYMFSFFALIDFVPDEVSSFSPAAIATTFKNSPEKVFDFKDAKVFKNFQAMYGNYANWDRQNRHWRNYLVHMTDIHTVVYSEPGKVTAAFCCAFNDPDPIPTDLRLVHFEDISKSHTMLVSYASDVIKFYKNCLGI